MEPSTPPAAAVGVNGAQSSEQLANHQHHVHPPRRGQSEAQLSADPPLVVGMCKRKPLAPHVLTSPRGFRVTDLLTASHDSLTARCQTSLRRRCTYHRSDPHRRSRGCPRRRDQGFARALRGACRVPSVLWPFSVSQRRLCPFCRSPDIDHAGRRDYLCRTCRRGFRGYKLGRWRLGVGRRLHADERATDSHDR
jgi:hypothetical protein